MNKQLNKWLALTVTTVILIFSSNAFADIRFGMGASGIASGSGDYETNTTAKLEAGLDLGKVWGLHGSYEKVDGDYKSIDFDGGLLKVGLDAGYKFELAIFDLKPYAKIGASFVDINSDTLDNLIDDGASVYYGVGVRGSITVFYVDIALENVDTGWGDTDTTGSITFGLVF